MNARFALVVLALAGCQTGVPRGGGTQADTVAGKGRVTPMHMVVAASVQLTPVDAAAPFTLTASDGSGLLLSRLDARAVVEGPLAFTELHLYFHNPEDRTREGTFTITLPPGAAISRFAMENAGEWQEAEVVEKKLARRAYDDFLHRRQDPALLEKAAGNQFSARVFPIAAKQNKHLVLSFSQELGGQAYTLPLRGLPKTEQVDVTLLATTADGRPANQALNQKDWQPDRDFVAAAPPAAAAVTAGDLVAGTFAFTGGVAAAAPADPPRQLTLLVDTSASRALGFKAYVASVRALISGLRTTYGDPIAVRVVAFDQDTQVVFDGFAADYGETQDATLLARGAAGASNLVQAIESLSTSRPLSLRRVVVITDAVVTAGPETPALVAAIKQLPADRLDVVLAGGIRDERLAATMVRAGLPHAGDVHDLDRGIDGVVAGLADPVLVDVPIEVPGAAWVYPRTVPAARPGSVLMVYARMKQPTRSIDVIIGGDRRTIGLGRATPALLARAVAGAEIEELENQLDAAGAGPAAGGLRDEITRRSVKHRVLSSQTSMLVLESEDDYKRYGIARTALADILVIGPDGVEATQRKAVDVIASDDPPPDEITARDRAVAEARERARAASMLAQRQERDSSDSMSGFTDSDLHGGLLGNEPGEANGGFGFGRSGFGPGGGGTGWGTVGTGDYGTLGHGSGTGSGYGVGSGRGGMRGRTSAVPQVRIGQPQVVGELDRAIIRRYIKRNIPRISFCYERVLLAKPRLAGTVTVQFLITATGATSGVQANGVDPEVARCIAGVIGAIEFPRPHGGGSVQVRYPLVFSPNGGASIDSDATNPLGTPPRPGRRRPPEPPPEEEEEPPPEEPDEPEDRGGPPLTGKLADVMAAIAARKADQALTLARAWHDESPGDVLALIALGEALEATRNPTTAARVYGSIIDLFPGRADLRRFAGERLERLGAPARKLVIDTYRRAVADRPDHATGHRLLAYALLRGGDHAGAFAAILAGVDQPYPEGRFRGATRVLSEDAGMIGAAYITHGGARDEVVKALTQRKVALPTQPSTRFILYWETDANDVDFHIRDARGGHAWYSNMKLRSGGELYADVTTGYGPECFAIEGKPTAAPYKLSINYYSQGPMGYGMGLLQIQVFDGKDITLEDRPYVIMTDHAFVDLGSYR